MIARHELAADLTKSGTQNLRCDILAQRKIAYPTSRHAAARPDHLYAASTLLPEDVLSWFPYRVDRGCVTQASPRTPGYLQSLKATLSGSIFVLPPRHFVTNLVVLPVVCSA